MDATRLNLKPSQYKALRIVAQEDTGNRWKLWILLPVAVLLVTFIFAVSGAFG